MKIQYIVYTPRHICRMGFIFGWLSTEHYVRDIFLMTSVAAIVATLMSIRFYLRITAGRCFTEVTNAPHPIPVNVLSKKPSPMLPRIATRFEYFALYMAVAPTSAANSFQIL